MSRQPVSRALAALCAAPLLAWCGAAGAQELFRLPLADESGPVLSLGGALRSGSSLYRGENPVLDLVPLYLAETRRFFAHGNAAGIHLWQNERWRLDAIGRYRFDYLDPDRSEPGFAGLRVRKQTVDAGVAVEYRSDWGELRAVLVGDTLSRHRGQELELTYRRRLALGEWQFLPYLSVSYQDQDLVDYYYGVSPEEAVGGLPVYRPDESINLTLGLNSAYRLTRNILLHGNVAFRRVGDEISDSPLVDESSELTAFVGGAYLFGLRDRRSSREVAGRSVWTYRLNYAYTAKENVLPWLMVGWWKPSNEADTRLMGFTVGRLLRAGRRADLYARVTAYRHFERDLADDDTWSFAGSLMVMGHGYLPWSDRLAFRWGFGWGLSYSIDILAVERIKQANRGNKTNRLLGYIEWQVDFPIDLLFESKLTRGCFFGGSVAHRSGIWGSSSFFGDVSGGSDFVGVHVECVR